MASSSSSHFLDQACSERVSASQDAASFSVKMDTGVESMSARRDPHTLTSLPEILSAISVFQSEEAELSNSLTQLLSARDPIMGSLARLHAIVPQLDELHLEASLLSQTVSSTAETAERVGGRVRSLDEEMRRVREAGDRVGQVMELKVLHDSSYPLQTLVLICFQSSLADLQASIDTQDWESATRHCAKAMSLPLEVISGPFAEAAVVSVSLFDLAA